MTRTYRTAVRTITLEPSATAVIGTNKKAKVVPGGRKQLSKRPVNVFSDEVQNSIVNVVLERLSGRSVLLHGVEKTKSDLMSNLRCAVKDYRGNSSILIGPHASGKSTLIKQLTDSIRDENPQIKIEKIILQGSIFAETQSVLKFLLTMMRELTNTTMSIVEEDEEISEFVAFDQLSALVKQFFSADSGKKQQPVPQNQRYLIFLLEDLERFAAHPQQNLLYCLFELALALPVYVIGTSCRIDVLELLEKRVKSRFSQNIVYLPLPETRECFIERIKANLIISQYEKYNEVIEAFLTKSKLFNDLCDFHFNFTKDVRPVFSLLSLTFASISEQFDWDTLSDHFASVHGPVRPELTLNTAVLDTTIVELMIIVAMCRLTSKFTAIPVTFDVMLEELSTCKLRAPGLENFVWTRSTLQDAFDRLIACRLLLPSSSALNSSSTWQDRSYLTVRLGLPSFVIIDALERHLKCSKEIFSLACERF